VSEPEPCPATVEDVVTVSVVDPPGASVALVEPEEANTAEAICGAPERLRVAVCDELETFVIRKIEVIVRADGMVPNASESESTSPLAMLVDVPG
jgi:hypothetical protein